MDVVLIRVGDDISALHGRCAHRGARMADGHIEGGTLVCGLHGWRYDTNTGIAPVNPSVALTKFPAWVTGGEVYVDESAVSAFADANPQPYSDDGYQGAWIKPTDTSEEPFVTQIHEFAAHGLSRVGPDGPVDAMGSRAIGSPPGIRSNCCPPSCIGYRCWRTNRSAPKR